ncbi:MAG: cupin domain-containing protein [Thermomicrobiales bacterium]
MLMQSGAVTLTVDGVDHLLNEGDTAIVPAEAVHRIANGGDVPASWMLIAPAGIKFFAVTGKQMHPA